MCENKRFLPIWEGKQPVCAVLGPRTPCATNGAVLREIPSQSRDPVPYESEAVKCAEGLVKVIASEELRLVISIWQHHVVPINTTSVSPDPLSIT